MAVKDRLNRPSAFGTFAAVVLGAMFVAFLVLMFCVILAMG